MATQLSYGSTRNKGAALTDPGRPRAVIAWLLACAFMVFAMAVIGAITRLTESGLSIMEWAPLSGTLPPLSDAEWQRLFALYKTIPQYQQINAGMSLAEFKTIFWWEYIHRLWGRSIGLVFALPLAWFWWRGRLPAWLKPHLLTLLGLGALQGVMGWYMVASGFADRVSVSQYRLTLHLGLAIFIYGYMLWLIFRLAWPDAGEESAEGPLHRLRRGLLGLLLLLSVTLVSGAFVAGLNAGLTYNSFPLMDGRLVPSGYGQLSPWILNSFENIAAVQFNHRLLASLTLLATLGIYFWALRLPLTAAGQWALSLVALAAVGQFTLGVVTLLAVVPVSLGAAHQAGALLLLTAVLHALYRLRPKA
ncbi:COX15/CtaA family protein [Fodinicurvata fenggangensis]|uniref:COX15/CtaA family protein n=1 Tax=Fodinicurvata fenggangensis TaxID=1121830 RepID=UPI00068AE07D|nr:COX15/CtaA family protein [Fodinicurvata fenggangensis]